MPTEWLMFNLTSLLSSLPTMAAQAMCSAAVDSCLASPQTLRHRSPQHHNHGRAHTETSCETTPKSVVPLNRIHVCRHNDPPVKRMIVRFPAMHW